MFDPCCVAEWTTFSSCPVSVYPHQAANSRFNRALCQTIKQERCIERGNDSSSFLDSEYRLWVYRSIPTNQFKCEGYKVFRDVKICRDMLVWILKSWVLSAWFQLHCLLFLSPRNLYLAGAIASFDVMLLLTEAARGCAGSHFKSGGLRHHLARTLHTRRKLRSTWDTDMRQGEVWASMAFNLTRKNQQLVPQPRGLRPIYHLSCLLVAPVNKNVSLLVENFPLDRSKIFASQVCDWLIVAKSLPKIDLDYSGLA